MTTKSLLRRAAARLLACALGVAGASSLPGPNRIALARNTVAAGFCKGAQTRLAKALCASATLREETQAFDAAFADALARAPDRADALRATERTWRDERDRGCIMPNAEAYDRCIIAQYKIRVQELALLVPKAQPPEAGAAINPGTYVSDAVIFRLDPNGEFDMRDLAGGRQASGHYETGGGVLTLLDGAGDVGTTTFPLRCRVVRTPDGFAVRLGQATCRQLDGLSFHQTT